MNKPLWFFIISIALVIGLIILYINYPRLEIFFKDKTPENNNSFSANSSKNNTSNPNPKINNTIYQNNTNSQNNTIYQNNTNSQNNTIYQNNTNSQIIVTRSISEFKNIGVGLNVSLDIYINDSAVALGIKENAPAGANITWCSESDSKIIENNIEILLFNTAGVKSQKITYTVVLNSATGTFTGNWISASPSLEGQIQGEISV